MNLSPAVKFLSIHLSREYFEQKVIGHNSWKGTELVASSKIPSGPNCNRFLTEALCIQVRVCIYMYLKRILDLVQSVVPVISIHEFKGYA